MLQKSCMFHIGAAIVTGGIFQVQLVTADREGMKTDQTITRSTVQAHASIFSVVFYVLVCVKLVAHEIHSSFGNTSA